MAGGGTGGHVMPLIAVAAELRGQGGKCLFIGTRNGMEAALAPKHGFPIEWIEIGGINRAGLRKMLWSALQLPAAVLRARRILKSHRAAAVFSTGGYAAGPTVIAAILTGTPVVAVEPNAIPGIVSRLTARWVRHALVSFDQTIRHFPPGRAERAGLPIREEFFRIAPPAPDAPFHVLVTGGSRGARSLNKAAREAWPVLREGAPRVSMTLQCGPSEEAELKAAFEGSGLDGEVTAFLDGMPAAYARASLIVSRSGAGAVSEIAAAGRPSILVPFPFAADGHQKHNALAMARAGAAVMIEDRDLDGASLARAIIDFAADPERARSMGAAARSLAMPGAARRAAGLLRECAGNIDRVRKPPEQ
ncbi:MAG: undecaprenyldiphospho-muramoylpentapeptide beta-N-acetylglucosaminyltransferase [Candidatus Solibacter sp.]|nr:undecaprenyldiphospho-muramoylpentapeptide beta-N-acetylglucosaminyltransferase [Candidatus Solibacter sp.]